MNTGSYTASIVPDDVEVGKYCSIAEDVYFCKTDDNHHCILNKKCVYTTKWGKRVRESIKIGHDVWIGRGARILPAVEIGNGAIIGAYAIVAKSVPPYAVVVGNPAVIKRYRFTPSQIEALEKIKWWDWDSDTIEKRKQDMEDVDEFINIYLPK